MAEMGGLPLKILWTLSVPLLTLVLPWAAPVRAVEGALRDSLLRMLPGRPATRVAVVLVDEEALTAGGPWPWRREQLARLVDRIREGGAGGVALDVLLPEPRAGDEALAAALSKGPSALAAGLDEEGHWLMPAPALRGARIGHVSFDLDGDGVVRHFSALKQMGDRALPALPVAAAQLVDPALPVPVGRILRPAFRTAPVPALSAATVLAGHSGDALKNRIVFLGSSAAGLGDRFVSPVSKRGSPEPGVFVEALATEAILSGDLLQVLPPWGNAVLALLLAGLGWGLLVSPRKALPAGAPLLILVPFPLAAFGLHVLNLEAAPVSMGLSLLLAGGVHGLLRSRKTRDAMTQARERLAELEALQSALALDRKQDAEARRVVAHELKTPLTSVRGLVQLLSRFDLSPAERERVVGLVATETARLSQMVDALLDLERLRLRNFEKDARPVDLSARCADRIEVLQAGIGRPLDARLETGIQVRGDGALLDRVLENLVSNAIKFSPEKAPVGITLRSLGDHAVLEVVDRGPGIPGPERSAIFGRFARGSNQALAPGLGLGLALVAEVVAWHQGSVEADGGPEGGSLFRVVLPRSGPGQSE